MNFKYEFVIYCRMQVGADLVRVSGCHVVISVCSCQSAVALKSWADYHYIPLILIPTQLCNQVSIFLSSNTNNSLHINYVTSLIIYHILSILHLLTPEPPPPKNLSLKPILNVPIMKRSNWGERMMAEILKIEMA